MDLIFKRVVADEDLQSLSEALGTKYDPKSPPSQDDLVNDIEAKGLEKIDTALAVTFAKLEKEKVQASLDSILAQVDVAVAAKLEATKTGK